MFHCTIAFSLAFFSCLSQLGYLARASVLSLEKYSMANVELQNGVDQCQGLVRFQDPIATVNTSSWYAQACSSTVGESEAIVICRQLGCNIISHARIVEPTQFGSSNVDFYAVFPYSCNGSEESLSSCKMNGELSCSPNDPLSAVAIDCHINLREIDKDNLKDLSSNLMVIIMCNIVIGLLIVVVPTDIVIIIYFIQKRSNTKPPAPRMPWSFI